MPVKPVLLHFSTAVSSKRASDVVLRVPANSGWEVKTLGRVPCSPRARGSHRPSPSAKGVPRPRLQRPRAGSAANHARWSLTEKPGPHHLSSRPPERHGLQRRHFKRGAHFPQPPSTSAPGNRFRGWRLLDVSHSRGRGAGRGRDGNAARTRARAAGTRAASRPCPDLRQPHCAGVLQEGRGHAHRSHSGGTTLEQLSSVLRSTSLSAGCHGDGTGLWNAMVHPASS